MPARGPAYRFYLQEGDDQDPARTQLLRGALQLVGGHHQPAGRDAQLLIYTKNF